jgi:Lsr2
MVVIGRVQLGGGHAGGEALQGGGKRGQVEALEMVQDVPSHAGQTGRERGAAIRAWAGEQGIAVSAWGRIPADVVARYEAATGGG